MSDLEHEQRIAREESYWNAPRMMMLGFGFLAVCLCVILTMGYLSEPSAHSLNPWW